MRSIFDTEIRSFCFSNRLNEEQDMSKDELISVATQIQTQLKSVQARLLQAGVDKTSSALRSAIINLETAKTNLKTTDDISKKVSAAGSIIEIIAGAGVFISSFENLLTSLKEMTSNAPSDASIESFLKTKNKSLEEIILEQGLTPDPSVFSKIKSWAKKATQSLEKSAKKELSDQSPATTVTAEGIGSWVGGMLARGTKKLVGSVSNLLVDPPKTGQEVAKYLSGENIFNVNIANALIKDLNKFKIEELNKMINSVLGVLDSERIQTESAKGNNVIFKIMFEEYDKYLRQLSEKLDVFDKRGNIVIGKDLKVIHVPTGFEYTVEDVINNEKGVRILLRKPDVPRSSATAVTSHDSINEIDDDEPYETVGDGESFLVTQKEFEKNYQEA